MGQSTNAQLDYGFDLGEFDELAEYSHDTYDLVVPWYDDEAKDKYGDEADITDQLYSALYAAIPADSREDTDNPYTQERIVKEHYGVEVQTYQSCEYPRYLLSTHQILVYRGDCKPIDFETLNDLAADGDFDAKLQRVLDVLSLRPKQQKPAWLLTSNWC